HREAVHPDRHLPRERALRVPARGGRGVDRGVHGASFARSTPHALARPSADRFRPTTRVASAMIGASEAHGTTTIAVRFSETISPQSGVGGLAPNPRKDSELISSTTQEACIVN